MSKKPKPEDTISVRLSRRNYDMLRERTRANGQSVVWLLNQIVELWFQEEAKK